MTIEKVYYDSTQTSVHGKDLAEAVDLIIRGRAQLDRVYVTMDLASATGGTPTALQGAPFGANATGGNGAKMWEATNTIKTLLDGDDAGGLKLALAALNNGALG